MNLVNQNSFEERLRNSISVAWNIFMNKVAHDSLQINKEASMQLHYANILHQILPLISYSQNENSWIELESSIQDIKGRTREIDLLLCYTSNVDDKINKIAIEMKCYRQKSSSGNNRGATDIFMKDAYEDLNLLEQYCLKDTSIKHGILIVMTDHKSLVHPISNKSSKCWDYDISHGAKTEPNIHLTTRIGGKNVDIKLAKSYTFNWIEKKNFYFLELEGT